MRHDDASACRALWAAVLERAVADYRATVHWRTMPDKTPRQRAARLAARRRFLEVRAWFLSESEEFPSFVTICEVVHIAPDRVLRALGPFLRRVE